MRLASVNVGKPETIEWDGYTRRTGINKRPVDGSVWIGTLGLDGDVQVDTNVHGGVYQAVYAYPAHHYDYWRATWPDAELPHGAFGENLTVTDVDESIGVGDELVVGSARLAVTVPRLPCRTLQTRMRRKTTQKQFLNSGRTGFYLKVVQEGGVTTGDPVEIVTRNGGGLTIADLVAFHLKKPLPAEIAARALENDALPPAWKERIARKAG